MSLVYSAHSCLHSIVRFTRRLDAIEKYESYCDAKLNYVFLVSVIRRICRHIYVGISRMHVLEYILIVIRLRVYGHNLCPKYYVNVKYSFDIPSCLYIKYIHIVLTFADV